ncbi:MAG: hypothetical protein Q8M31_08845 [Beijerinckiaceae bacterium]|nr:hypothetical protein [Beijerinckiaceae bacterium]
MSNGDEPKAPPPPEEWAKSDTWSDDYFALKEEEKFPNEAELKSAHDHNKIRVVKHSGIIIVVILWVVSLLFVSSFACWMWHQIAPQKWMWMAKEQLDQIKTIIFSGAIGGLMTTAVQKYIMRD